MDTLTALITYNLLILFIVSIFYRTYIALLNLLDLLL
jgi:hypothetical protein